MSKKQRKITNEERVEARRELLKLLKPGTTVYTAVEHVSKSGMTRRIGLYIVAPRLDSVFTGERDANDERIYKRRKKYVIRNISWLAAKAAGFSWHSDSCTIVMTGCGMDMGFAAVYELGCSLWPNGTRKPHGTRNGQPDTAGGYALKQEWL